MGGPSVSNVKWTFVDFFFSVTVLSDVSEHFDTLTYYMHSTVVTTVIGITGAHSFL